MRKGAGQRPDLTAGTAVGNVSGDALLASVLAVIEDDLDQVLVLGHGALNLPVAYLARRLALDRRDVEDRVARALATLRANAALTNRHGNVSRAGQFEHFHALAFRLGLLDWFCAYCGQPLTQPRVGRPRRTCGQRCRQKLARTGGVGWKDSYRPAVHQGGRQPNAGQPSAGQPSASQTRNLPARPGAGDVSSERLIKLIAPVERGEDRWRQPPARSRDLAILLLGFTCQIPVTPGDLAALDCYDIGRSRDSMQVVLFRNSARPTRYVAITDAAAPTCPVRATFSWRERLARAGLASGPLFIELTGTGRLPGRARRLTGNQVCEIISAAASRASTGSCPEISVSTPLPAFLGEIEEPHW